MHGTQQVSQCREVFEDITARIAVRRMKLVYDVNDQVDLITNNQNRSQELPIIAQAEAYQLTSNRSCQSTCHWQLHSTPVTAVTLCVPAIVITLVIYNLSITQASLGHHCGQIIFEGVAVVAIRQVITTM